MAAETEPAGQGDLEFEHISQAHRDADGVPRWVTVRWLGAWQAGGFDGLKPARRRDADTHRTDPVGRSSGW